MTYVVGNVTARDNLVIAYFRTRNKIVFNQDIVVVYLYVLSRSGFHLDCLHDNLLPKVVFDSVYM